MLLRSWASAAGSRPGNGLFTAAMLDHFEESGHILDIRMLMGRVRDTVLTSSSDQQRPWTHCTLGAAAVFVFPDWYPVSVPEE